MKFVSEGCKLVTGYDSSELQNNQVISYGDLIYPEDKDSVRIKFQQSLETKTPYKNEYRIIDNEGKIRWVYEQAEGNYTPDGTLLTIEGFIQNISEQRTALYERQLAEFALAEAKSAAETATKVQSKFMADMSYKIRTAMNGVLGMAQLLTTTNLTREQQNFIQTILDSSEEILTITKNILYCSEVESEISNLESRVVVLEDILRSICTQSKNTELPHIEIDPQMAEKFPLRILLAENNLVNQKVIYQILQKFGYQVDIVSNGIEAVKAVQNQAYDLVLMNIEMPEMGGLTATRKIRQKLTIQPQIVAMIANVLAEDYYTCLDSGMDDYITKPIKINEMIRILHSKHCPF
jgi:PAS domain S-box-containing protein